MRKFFSYIRIVLGSGPRVLWYQLIYFIRYAKNPKKYPIDKRYKKARHVMKKTLDGYRAEIHVEGLENIECLDEKLLFISNHLSEADPLLIMSVNKKPVTFVAKKQTLNMPFIGTILRAVDGIPIDRDNIMNQIKEIKNIVETIKGDDTGNVCIFAEGTRNKNPENHCLEFHGGSIKMGYMAKVKIVPVALYGTFRLFSINHFLRRYPVYIKFGKPISPAQYEKLTSVELADQLREQIDTEVDRFRLLDKKEVCAQRLSKKRKLFEIQADNNKLSS